MNLLVESIRASGPHLKMTKSGFFVHFSASKDDIETWTREFSGDPACNDALILIADDPDGKGARIPLWSWMGMTSIVDSLDMSMVDEANRLSPAKWNSELDSSIAWMGKISGFAMRDTGTLMASFHGAGQRA